MTNQEQIALNLEGLHKTLESEVYKALREAYTRGYIDGLDAAADIVTRDIPSILKPQVG